MIRLLRDLVPHHVLSLLITETVLIFCCYVLAIHMVLDADPGVYLMYDGGLGRIVLIEFTFLTGVYLTDMYSDVQARSRMHLVQQACQVLGFAFLLQALMGYVNPGLTLPRWPMLLGSGLSLATFVSWRLFYGSVLVRAVREERILFLGDNAQVLEISEFLGGHPEFGMRVVGSIEDQDGRAAPAAAPACAGRSERLRQIVAETKPDRIVVGMRERREHVPILDLLELRFEGIRIEESAAAYERVFKRVPLTELRPSQLIYSGELGPGRRSLDLQLVYSLLLALICTVLLSPVMLIVALAVKLSSRGPVFYRQTRVGWQGRTFTLYKFRSMRADAEAETGAVWASKDDPRVTRVGRWLRLLRLDELPQFFNVLVGEMSLVGPRPERPEFVGQLSEKIPFYPQRLCVRPGITGWAQVNHKYGDTLEDAARKLEYDLYYIKHLSPALDLFIMFHTLKTVLLSRGAQ